jgi:hypothetical protein
MEIKMIQTRKPSHPDEFLSLPYWMNAKYLLLMQLLILGFQEKH